MCVPRRICIYFVLILYFIIFFMHYIVFFKGIFLIFQNNIRSQVISIIQIIIWRHCSFWQQQLKIQLTSLTSKSRPISEKFCDQPCSSTSSTYYIVAPDRLCSRSSRRNFMFNQRKELISHSSFITLIALRLRDGFSSDLLHWVKTYTFKEFCRVFYDAGQSLKVHTMYILCSL